MTEKLIKILRDIVIVLLQPPPEYVDQLSTNSLASIHEKPLAIFNRII